MEDLVEDRNLGPREAAAACDFLTMHGYPGYATWTDGATDERLLPFLTRVTRWLGGGAEVMFTEFGVPTVPVQIADRAASTSARVGEKQAASYVSRGLSSLRAAGATGAMLWCYADYREAIWSRPPLDQAVHERTFGLWRANGSPKPAVDTVRAFSQAAVADTVHVPLDDAKWIDLDAADFYDEPGALSRLFRRYCDALKSER
jgi:endo-1,4-beta-mannosidase